jgi:2-polyprenyl-3-methyl-5-hydroxy-6-metoxy-1,4-benzoquinol methylase
MIMLKQSSPQNLFCPACGQATVHKFLYNKNGCDVLKCNACGLGRSKAKAFDPTAYYTAGYFSGRLRDGYADYLGTEQVLRREFARTADFVRSSCPSGKLLEIGCAYGFFLKEAMRYFDVSGIELSDDAAAHCRQAGLNVVSGEADETNLKRFGNMDVIVMLDVVEHLRDPYRTLSACAKKLNPGGIIVLTTGDFGSSLARLTGAKWRLMTPPQHQWFFTAESIRRWSAHLGMTLERLDHPWKIVPLSLILFQLRRMVGFGFWARPSSIRMGVPINLFDAMRIVLRRCADHDIHLTGT